MPIVDRLVTLASASGASTHHLVAIMHPELVVDISQNSATTLLQPTTTSSQQKELSVEIHSVASSNLAGLGWDFQENSMG